jgi:glyoxylase-like metal-dependent hydrolase (beta-lactamase superfamily II)
VQRIGLDNVEFEGNNAVYLFDGDDGPTTLVDTGSPTADARDQLVGGLSDHGVAPADLDRILLTHHHSDHSGLAGYLQDESGATVHAHPADVGLVERDEAAWEEMEALRDRALEEWGMPEGPSAELTAFLGGFDLEFGPAPAVDPIEAGDRIPAGDHELEVLALPGHAAGLVGFAFDDGGERHLLSGDALLPKYTPNVGGADLRVESPLAKYLDTLVRIARGGYDRAWPGHRDPIEDSTARALAILRHHRERTKHVVDVLESHGPATAWTVGAHLFGDLSGIHILHGPGESFAHLEHLHSAGVVDHAGIEYELVTEPGGADLDALFPPELTGL